jgi:hypothetical protein
MKKRLQMMFALLVRRRRHNFGILYTRVLHLRPD